MWEWVGKAGSWLADGKNLQGLGSALGAGGSIFGGIKQASAANKMIGLENEKFQFNKDLLLADEEEKKRQKEAYARAYGTGVVPL
ncbi:MAG: hypothetical protein AB7D34_01175 [Sulfurimonas sp.]